MPITVDTPSEGGPPALKFGDVGSYADVGIVNVEDVQTRDYDTGDLEFWDDGKPKMSPRITGLIIAGTGAFTGTDDQQTPVEPGQIVTIYAQDARYFAWRDAKKEHGAVTVGDVLRWKFDRTQAPTNPKFKGNPRKVFKAKLRHPRDEDGDLVARCEEAYHARSQRTPVDSPTAAVADPAPF